MSPCEQKSESYLLIPLADVFRTERNGHVRYLGELINIRNAVHVYVVNSTTSAGLRETLQLEKSRVLGILATEKDETGYAARLRQQAALLERLADHLHDKLYASTPHADIVRIVSKDLKRELEPSDLIYLSWSGRLTE